MSLKKDIDRLFQEQMKDFEAMPSPQVWEGIEAKLDDKKKRRMLPIWWWGSGIAASILIIVLLYPFKNGTPQNGLPDIIITDSPIEKEQNEKRIDEQLKNKIINNAVVNNHQTKNKTETNTVPAKKYKTLKNTINPKTKAIAFTYSHNFDLIDFKIALKKGLAGTLLVDIKNTAEQDSLFIKSKIEKKDFIAELNSLEENKIKKENKEMNTGRWAVVPTVGLVNSASFTNTSPIDESLNGKTTQGNNTLSYGVKVNYQLSDKWELQSGVFQQEMAYTTNNLVVSNSLRAGNLSSVDYNLGSGYVIEANADFDVDTLDGLSAVADENAELNQSYSYIEVPFEAKYKVLEKNKFKTQLIAGFSTLLLQKNTIAIESSVLSQEIGSANNLNNINFSSNFGFDFNYRLSKKVSWNIMPMFKMQWKTFSKNSNNFKPYTIGIHTGLSYKF